MLSAMGMQCNHHRATAPNARTQKQAAMLAHIRATGATAAETEARFGTTAGPTVR